MSLRMFLMSLSGLICLMGPTTAIAVVVFGTNCVARAADGPKVQRALPSGGQVGKTHEVTLSGTFPIWPVQFWTDATDITINPLEASGKISVTVAPHAEPGVRYFRAYDATGASELIPFLIDRCADLLEQEPNDHHAKSQSVDQLPVSVHGCLEKSGDVDTFQVPLVKGQTLVASLDGQRFLGSPMDADLQVLTTRGIVLAQQLDHHGLDPELKFTAPHDGIFLVRLMAFPDTPNSTIAYAGGDKFVYRLLLTSGPYLDFSFPASLSRQQVNELQLFGSNIHPDQQQQKFPALDSVSDSKWFSIPGFQGIVQMPVTKSPCVVEVEPNELKSPQHIPVPSIITGNIATGADRDSFQFASESGQRWKLSIEANKFGSPLDAVLTIDNTEGKQLATNDDVAEARDPALSFAAPAAGNFVVTVHDTFRHSSLQHWYRLIIEPELPDYALSLSSDSFTGKVGQPIEVVVSIQRQLEFAADISVGLEQPLTSGSNPPVVSKKADDSGKSVKLLIQSDQPFSGPIRIVGHCEQAMDRIAKPEKTDCTWLWLSITP